MGKRRVGVNPIPYMNANVGNRNYPHKKKKNKKRMRWKHRIMIAFIFRVPSFLRKHRKHKEKCVYGERRLETSLAIRV